MIPLGPGIRPITNVVKGKGKEKGKGKGPVPLGPQVISGPRPSGSGTNPVIANMPRTGPGTSIQAIVRGPDGSMLNLGIPLPQIGIPQNLAQMPTEQLINPLGTPLVREEPKELLVEEQLEMQQDNPNKNWSTLVKEWMAQRGPMDEAPLTVPPVADPLPPVSIPVASDAPYNEAIPPLLTPAPATLDAPMSVEIPALDSQIPTASQVAGVSNTEQVAANEAAKAAAEAAAKAAEAAKAATSGMVAALNIQFLSQPSRKSDTASKLPFSRPARSSTSAQSAFSAAETTMKSKKGPGPMKPKTSYEEDAAAAEALAKEFGEEHGVAPVDGNASSAVGQADASSKPDSGDGSNAESRAQPNAQESEDAVEGVTTRRRRRKKTTGDDEEEETAAPESRDDDRARGRQDSRARGGDDERARGDKRARDESSRADDDQYRRNERPRGEDERVRHRQRGDPHADDKQYDKRQRTNESLSDNRARRSRSRDREQRNSRRDSRQRSRKEEEDRGRTRKEEEDRGRNRKEEVDRGRRDDQRSRRDEPRGRKDDQRDRDDQRRRSRSRDREKEKAREPRDREKEKARETPARPAKRGSPTRVAHKNTKWDMAVPDTQAQESTAAAAALVAAKEASGKLGALAMIAAGTGLPGGLPAGLPATIGQPQFTGGAKKQPYNVCIPFLCGDCFDTYCPAWHPSTPAEFQEQIQRFSQRQCSAGAKCNRRRCLYRH